MVAAVVASEQGLDYAMKNMPRQTTTIWTAVVDEELTSRSYIGSRASEMRETWPTAKKYSFSVLCGYFRTIPCACTIGAYFGAPIRPVRRDARNHPV